MSKRRKVSVIVAGDRHTFKRYRNVVPILSGTCVASATRKGIICITGSQAGVSTGNCYITIDTAGTGTKINA